MKRLYTLLAAWLVAAIGPALLVQIGVFGPVLANKDLNGPVLGLWIGGYLAQFGIFFWIGRIADKGVFLGWFVSSILPWGIDFTLPVSPLFALLWIPIGVVTVVYIGRSAARSDSLREHGIRATGVVLQVYRPAMNVVINNVYIKRKVRVRIERSDKMPPYEGTLDGLYMIGNLPSAGNRIPLLVDPNDPQHFAYDESAGNAAASTETDATQPSGRGNVADQLNELADLHDRGALDDTEFAAAKNKLLER